MLISDHFQFNFLFIAGISLLSKTLCLFIGVTMSGQQPQHPEQIHILGYSRKVLAQYDRLLISMQRLVFFINQKKTIHFNGLV